MRGDKVKCDVTPSAGFAPGFRPELPASSGAIKGDVDGGTLREARGDGVGSADTFPGNSDCEGISAAERTAGTELPCVFCNGTARVTLAAAGANMKVVAIPASSPAREGCSKLP